MSTRENIAAVTERFGYAYYPAFLSINRLPDGSVSIAVRARDTSSPAEIVLSREEFEQVKADLSGVR